MRLLSIALVGVAAVIVTGIVVDVGTVTALGQTTGPQTLVLQLEWLENIIRAIDNLLEAIADLLRTIREIFGGGGGD